MASKAVKIVLVGDGACGKTSCLHVFARGEFPTTYIPTIFDNYVCQMEIPGKGEVSLTLFDTAGQEDYEMLRPLSYAETHCIIIMCDVLESNSIDNINYKWIHEIKNNIHTRNVPIIIAGNKIDLRNDNRVLQNRLRNKFKIYTTSEIEKLLKNTGYKKYIECSAKDNINLQELFMTAGFYGYCYKNGIAVDQNSNRKSKFSFFSKIKRIFTRK